MKIVSPIALLRVFLNSCKHLFAQYSILLNNVVIDLYPQSISQIKMESGKISADKAILFTVKPGGLWGWMPSYRVYLSEDKAKEIEYMFRKKISELKNLK